jgi:hypothetical protein
MTLWEQICRGLTFPTTFAGVNTMDGKVAECPWFHLSISPPYSRPLRGLECTREDDIRQKEILFQTCQK